MPTFTRRSRTAASQIVSALLTKNGPMVIFASDTSLRDTSTSGHDWLRRRGGSVFWFCARSWASWRKLHRSPCEHWLSFSTGNQHLFLLQCRFIGLDLFHCSWINSLVPGVKFCLIEVSDLYSSSPWFATFDTWASISSDESPCRKIPIRLWVAQTHVSSICTDFPRNHRMEFLTSTTELLLISYRIPECYNHEQ